MDLPGAADALPDEPVEVLQRRSICANAWFEANTVAIEACCAGWSVVPDAAQIMLLERPTGWDQFNSL